MDTFQDYYQEKIAPKLKKIDLFFKMEQPQDEKTLSLELASELLDLNEEEIKHILDNHGFTSLNKVNFFMVMKEGSSEICQLFNRQICAGINDAYSSKQIAYIYQIPEEIIRQAMKEADIEQITIKNLDKLFSYIYIEV